MLVAIGAVGCRPLVLSSYGSMVGVRSGLEGTNQFRSERHDGVDIRAYEIGSPVLASAEGLVVDVRDDRLAGKAVTIVHSEFGLWTKYVHLRSVSVDVGAAVRRGQKIGEVGLFARSGGVVHVHWMLCRRPDCYGYGSKGGTWDPIDLSAGCFDSDDTYATDRLVLTYPVDC